MRMQRENTRPTQTSPVQTVREARPVLSAAGEAQGNMVIRVPMRLKRDRGRKQIVAPAGLEGPVVFSRGQAQQALVLALAHAHRWSRMLERGEVSSINELAQQHGVNASLIGRTLLLATLAPDITQAILAGQEPYGLSIRKLTKGLPSAWNMQRMRHGFTEISRQLRNEISQLSRGENTLRALD